MPPKRLRTSSSGGPSPKRARFSNTPTPTRTSTALDTGDVSRDDALSSSSSNGNRSGDLLSAGPAAIKAIKQAIVDCNPTENFFLQMPFNPEVTVLHIPFFHVYAEHGISFSHMASIAEFHSAFLAHILSGACFLNQSPNHSCSIIVTSFTQDSKLFLSDMLEYICTSDLSLPQLLDIGSILGMSNPFQNSCKSALEAVTWINQFRHGFSSLQDASSLLCGVHLLSRPDLLIECDFHGALYADASNEDLRQRLVHHLLHSCCQADPSRSQCVPTAPGLDAQISLIRAVLDRNIPARAAKLILSNLGALIDPAERSTKKLRAQIRSHLSTILQSAPPPVPSEVRHQQLKESWPSIIPSARKKELLDNFRSRISSKHLSSLVCAVCSERKFVPKFCAGNQLISEYNLDVLQVAMPAHWNSSFPADPILASIVVHPPSVQPNHSDPMKHSWTICKICDSYLQRKKLPPCAIANKLYVGDVPDALKDLTLIEEALIAQRRCKATVIQLRKDRHVSSATATGSLPTQQRAMRGHCIIFPQSPDELCKILPRSMSDAITPICVVFIGSSAPTQDWLMNHAKPLIVRREKVRAALLWLKQNNPLYRHVRIDETNLDSLPHHGVAPVSIESHEPSSAENSQGSRYDAPEDSEGADNSETTFQNVVVSGIDIQNSSSNVMRAAALRHLKKGGGFVQIPHKPVPSNEYEDSDLFPLLYPTLFPFGTGGFQLKRTSPLSAEMQARHLFSLADRRFQEHYSFPFVIFNMLQRAICNTQVKIKTSAKNFGALASQLNNIPDAAFESVINRLAKGDHTTASSDDEYHVLNLMRNVSTISAKIPCSSHARTVMRNEIRGLMFQIGLPSFFITINPADCYSPLVQFLAGKEIDIENLFPDDISSYWDQSVLIAKNPFIATQFFDEFINAFISEILAFDKSDVNQKSGILGVVKGYYGCIEAQGRGTLHCHMLIWIEGSLNPQEIKDRILRDKDYGFESRLKAFLDDTIHTAIPKDPGSNITTLSDNFHPCAVHCPTNASPEEVQKDLRNLVSKCQVHTHTGTCYKYWKGPPEPKTCQFELGPERERAETVINHETGEISHRVIDGLVNNFCETIIQAVRCNMDIKFIGSGQSAKAILYYITDYITKSQLSTHTAYSVLLGAVRKLEAETSSTVSPVPPTVKAKRLLVKCANSIISKQELSAPQVASYLLGYKEYYTSHTFRPLYWKSFEQYLEQNDPLKLASAPTTSVDELESELEKANRTLLGDERLGEDEVVIETRDGEIVAQASHLMDYIARGSEPEFTDLSLWDFTSFTEKERIRERPNTAANDTPSNRKRGRPLNPRSFFLSCHPESATHALRLRNPENYLVPVPIGPGIYRRHVADKEEHYYRLMLLLFVPWRKHSDLRNDGETWKNAFERWKTTLSQHHLAVIENMQLLHECKDSRDAHYAQRRIRLQSSNGDVLNSGIGRTMPEAGLFDENIEDDILEQLIDGKSSRSRRIDREALSALEAVQSAELAGLFTDSDQVLDGADSLTESCPEWSQYTEVNDLESEWKNAYSACRNAARLSLVEQARRGEIQDPNHEQSLAHISVQTAYTQHPTQAQIRIVSSAIEGQHQENLAEELIKLVTDSFTLNTEQAHAFRLIAERSTSNDEAPMLMYLGGAGGTGKSRVIEAVSEFFRRRGEERRFRLASYTGIAAKNISGMTLHTVLNLGQLDSMMKKNGSRSRQQLISAWSGVDFLFIDEISMVGCELLVDISLALSIAKENSLPFGGINIIFAGDFCQLPPVGGTPLYTSLERVSKTPRDSLSDAGIKKAKGLALWKGLTHAVLLVQSMRQAGSGNLSFRDLLGRLRYGNCIQSDIALLETRILGTAMENLRSDAWLNAPIITTSNTVKDALNTRAVEDFAERTRQQIEYYYAEDLHQGVRIPPGPLRDYLLSIHSGRAHQTMGCLPLVKGMPVIIGENYDVNGGIVNGSEGVLKSIRYNVDDDGRRHAVSAIVTVTQSSGTALPHLAPYDVAVLQSSHNFTIKHPESGKEVSFVRKQLPLLPAFALTDYKSQGKTLHHVIVDLHSCSRLSSAYVMISRATTLEGLLILRPFNPEKLMVHAAEDFRHELHRLNTLSYMTILGSPTEYNRHEAARHAMNNSPQINLENEHDSDCG